MLYNIFYIIISETYIYIFTRKNNLSGLFISNLEV